MDTGVVDPGFHGNVSFTIINLGSKPFAVEAGQAIATAMIFELDSAADKQYSNFNNTPYDRRYEAVANLPHDLLGVVKQVEMKTEDKINKAVKTIREDYFHNVVVPLFLAPRRNAGRVFGGLCYHSVRSLGFGPSASAS